MVREGWGRAEGGGVWGGGRPWEESGRWRDLAAGRGGGLTPCRRRRLRVVCAGAQLLVSLTGGHNLIYDCLRPEVGPTKWFGGHTVTSFYIKACFSPDGAFIASGSNDRLVYIWQVEGGDGAAPVSLPGHEGEVTALAWCRSDFGQLASTADDSTLRVWNIQRTRQEAETNGKAPARGWQVCLSVAAALEPAPALGPRCRANTCSHKATCLPACLPAAGHAVGDPPGQRGEPAA